MKLLLDENLDVKLRFRFGPAHAVMTVRQMDWLGKEKWGIVAAYASQWF